ncbi:hypothetical protein D3C80_1656940 [compost metagenome]
MAMATESRNCCSVSHLFSTTTPECKKGTMARPLPNTKAPALVKKMAIFIKVELSKFQKPDEMTIKTFVVLAILKYGRDLISI